MIEPCYQVAVQLCVELRYGGDAELTILLGVLLMSSVFLRARPVREEIHVRNSLTAQMLWSFSGLMTSM
jgi:hypothetical protein